jgi:hypothetical protein
MCALFCCHSGSPAAKSTCLDMLHSTRPAFVEKFDGPRCVPLSARRCVTCSHMVLLTAQDTADLIGDLCHHERPGANVYGCAAHSAPRRRLHTAVGTRRARASAHRLGPMRERFSRRAPPPVTAVITVAAHHRCLHHVARQFIPLFAAPPYISSADGGAAGGTDACG